MFESMKLELLPCNLRVSYNGKSMLIHEKWYGYCENELKSLGYALFSSFDFTYENPEDDNSWGKDDIITKQEYIARNKLRKKFEKVFGDKLDTLWDYLESKGHIE